jgi:uncharacterized protein YkwD
MPHPPRLTVAAALLFSLSLSALLGLLARPSEAQAAGRLFLQTGHTVREPFLSAWAAGGVELFGYPISGELSEQSRDDGQLYTVQYFERARLELHPGATPQVQLGRIGAELAPPAPTAPAAPDGGCLRFAETSQVLCDDFAALWAARGGVAIFGLPLGPATPQLGADGVLRSVQYTERARLERDPASGQISLGLLGRELHGGEPAPPLAALAAEELRLVELVNQERAAAGLAPLDIALELSAAAEGHSQGMAKSGLISHSGADGRGPAQRMADAGYRWLRCGENIAVGQLTPEEAMAFWMNSPPHRANILDPGMREIGAGYVRQEGGYGHYWTITLGAR